MKWLSFICLLALALAGCARRPFVLGLYDVPARALPAVAAAGFDTVTIGYGETNRPAYLDAARQAGLKAILWPALATSQGLKTTARLDAHPAAWGWYLEDEPDLNIISPETLQERRRKLRQVARKPVYLVVASGPAVEKYGSLAEVVAVDSYPISWAPLAVVSREMRAARLAARGRPFFAVLQAFDWSVYPELLRTDAPQRPPTHEEMRCMAFLSLFHGAQGLLFYSYRAGAWDIEQHPAVWEALTNTVAEVRRLAPVFRERVPWAPVRSRYDGPPSEMHNEIHEGRVALNLFRVRKREGAIAPGHYIVAINTSPEPASFSFTLPFRGVSELSTYCAPGPVTARAGWISKNYSPFEVCIFGPVQQPLLMHPPP